MTVSDQIIKVLDALCEKFGLAIDWTAENVMPYLEMLGGKLISYEIWTSVAWVAIMTVLSIGGIVIAVALRHKLRESIEYGEGFVMIPYFFLGILWLATVLCVGFETFDIIKCTVFPEMYIFEYIQGMINGG